MSQLRVTSVNFSYFTEQMCCEKESVKSVLIHKYKNTVKSRELNDKIRHRQIGGFDLSSAFILGQFEPLLSANLKLKKRTANY